MLLGLAEQGNAPQFLKKVNQRGIPVPALLLSAGVTALCVVINYLMPQSAFEFLMMLVVAALVINWLMISVTHLKFRRAMQQQGVNTRFQSWASPWTNYLTIAFMFFILIVMSMTEGMRIAVMLIPSWLVILCIMYYFNYREKPVTVSKLPEIVKD
jgi:aromatic amino acid transport protein AroP